MSFLQVVVNGLITGALYSLLSVGYTTLYGMLDFPNFSFAEFAVLGAYLGLLFSSNLNLVLPLAVIIAALLAGITGVLTDKVVFSKIRNANRISLMIASFGLSLVIRNTLRGIWGSRPKGFPIPLQSSVNFLSSYVRITPIQIVIILTVGVAMFAIYLLLYKTKLGKSMRAVRDNPGLAEASGIDAENVIAWVWFIAVFTAAIGGILYGLETQVHPYMGISITIKIFCATILGGLGHPLGAVVGSMILGFAQNVLLWVDLGPILNLGGIFHFVGRLQLPTGYKDSIAFLILILIFLFRPTGLLGRR